MAQWSSTKSRRVLAALKRIGWREKRTLGSHRILERDGWPDFVFAFHDKGEIGPKMLARIAKRTGLEPDDSSGWNFTLRRRRSVVFVAFREPFVVRLRLPVFRRFVAMLSLLSRLPVGTERSDPAKRSADSQTGHVVVRTTYIHCPPGPEV